ncbi:hypothetical protein [Chelatococcus composti]|jgi:hypothetical protein|uniref:Uncharacterized protein n=1 Tax=Chelatococcus composti TaxID=1743235 RepID=A0A841K6V5_9HYPH|nr:hypothetical protein [Chelatococcus composti]MBB6168025.1 hypothetical protein [Chelatococcus composti]MBS7734784.1 hypothetical protein [Chelatococcus composti]PZN45443.1 MAG: hypothetical protein DIU59_02040 [Pseudomonadota bacterium]GGG34108.1 hypothetical protein GCM10008026_13540 [Chelatococcus composti]
MIFRNVLFASVLLAAAAAPALAQQTPIPSRAHSCAELQELVQQKGRAVISRGPHLYTAYVSNCSPGDFPVPEYVPTRDKDQCFVGYTCR